MTRREHVPHETETGISKKGRRKKKNELMEQKDNYMPVIDRNVRLFSLADLDKGAKFYPV